MISGKIWHGRIFSIIVFHETGKEDGYGNRIVLNLVNPTSMRGWK
jgi:hypothetical protein